MAAKIHKLSDIRSFAVHCSADFLAIRGANEGDCFGVASELTLDDVYALRTNAEVQHLALTCVDGSSVVAPASGIGTEGNAIHVDCVATLMDFGIKVTDVLVLVEVDGSGHTQDIYLIPMAPLEPKREYSLLRIDARNAAQKIARLACASFTRCTKITLGTGQQCPVETLAPGDRVLTRDNGVQELRWVGHYTERAIGSFAPIRITAGTLNNTNDLIVSPDHRLFFYQRVDQLAVGRSELMIRAKHLVNDHSVSVQEGGFVEYIQLLFDDHQIIYAEGIAVESLTVGETKSSILEHDLHTTCSPSPVFRPDLGELSEQTNLLHRNDVVAALNRASKG